MRLALAILLAVVVCSPVFADTVLLVDLLPDGEYIDSGDLRFDNFQYRATGDMPSAGNINVTTMTDQYGHYGISFQGGFIDLFGGGASDSLIEYRVTSLDENKMISDAHIVGNPYAVGRASMSVLETFLVAIPDKEMFIRHDMTDPAPDPSKQRMDSVIFDDIYRSLNVQKDILALASEVGSEAYLSFVDQSFSQVTIPEPSSVAFLLSGIGLLACCVRRRGR